MLINNILYTKLIIHILVSVLITGCSNVQIKELEKKVQDMQDNLYVPDGAVLLNQVSDAGYKKYVAPNCMVAAIKSAYGINRSLPSVINEYYDKLTHENWQLNPLYDSQKTDEHIFLSGNSQLELTIYSIRDPGAYPLKVEESKIAQFATIYIVDLVYSAPSSADCRV